MNTPLNQVYIHTRALISLKVNCVHLFIYNAEVNSFKDLEQHG